jgi:crotonobetainyl-CoA:carnitine CoA-transferase CaiB-like acyl-CoA transferase
MERPLSDMRVIAIEQFGAGPWATLQLAELGADVIKIEDPQQGGDVGRYVPPFQQGEDSLFFETFNHHKQSISLDLRTDAGRAVFLKLATKADAVFSNLRGDLPHRLGLTYDQLKHVNPSIVCCSLSGFGMTGPRAAEPAYDYVLQGIAGWMSLTGEPSGPPAKSGLSLVDFSAGYVAAIAMIAGIWSARRTGTGCDCDLSLFDTALAQLVYIGTWVATAGYQPERLAHSAHPSLVPFQNFRTATGWIVVACAKQKFWERMCAVIERLDLLDDPRYSNFESRDVNRDSLIESLTAIFLERSAEAWLEVLRGAGIPCGPVNEVADALRDPQAVARGNIVETDHPTLGRVRKIASAVRVGTDRIPPAPAPTRGEHTDQIMIEVCGYTLAELEGLRQAGAFGDTGPVFLEVEPEQPGVTIASSIGPD